MPSGDLGVGNDWVWGDFTGQNVVAFQSALWFDVQSQISGRQIKHATLRLWPYSLPADWNTWYEARAFAGSWSGNTITFADAPEIYLSGIASVSPPTTTSLRVEWNVTTIVQYWANGTWVNNNFNLADGRWVFPNDTLLRGTSFESLEYWFNYDHRPKLIIEFQ